MGSAILEREVGDRLREAVWLQCRAADGVMLNVDLGCGWRRGWLGRRVGEIPGK